jgi:RNA polymerase sigma factor (TIGR02999 family)
MQEQRGTPAAMAIEQEVYEHLKEVAAAYLAKERRDHTLQPTALVHEAYVRLSRSGRLGSLGRADLVCLASRAMRRVLVDHARRKRATKRGGGMARAPLDGVAEEFERSAVDLLALDTALEDLERMEPDLARIVSLRFFGGLTEEEVAVELGVSARTVRRGWVFARMWLASQLKGDGA